MRRRATTAAVRAPAAGNVLRAISLTVLVLMILAWSHAAKGSETITQDGFAADPSIPASPAQLDNAETAAESVTMSIPLEEDGVIDVEAPRMDVKIEKWDGNDVLLIVEKKKARATANRDPPSPDTVTIQVSREGRNVRIETAGDAKKRENLADVSFRIVLPEDAGAAVKLDDQSDILDRLVAVVWRAFCREALRCLTH